LKEKISHGFSRIPDGILWLVWRRDSVVEHIITGGSLFCGLDMDDSRRCQEKEVQARRQRDVDTAACSHRDNRHDPLLFHGNA